MYINYAFHICTYKYAYMQIQYIYLIYVTPSSSPHYTIIPKTSICINMTVITVNINNIISHIYDITHDKHFVLF